MSAMRVGGARSRGHASSVDRVEEWKETMDRNDELVLLISLYLRRRRRRALSSQRSTWIRLIFQRRRDQGDYHQLLQEMRLGDAESHFRFLRMSKERFDMLLAKVISLFISYTDY